jgi:hypothetical protein
VTAALEAAGALPHRQMVLRVTGLSHTLIAAALDILEGLIEEDEQVGSPGIYTWRTRHEVIARLISRYKYAEPTELKALLDDVISTANPSYFLEARTLREICITELGIRALPDPNDRIDLYRKVIEALPADRVARHRLVRELVYSDRLGDAEAELRNAVEDVGLDPPLQRYRVLMHVYRSRGQGLMDQDRRAILKVAQTEAQSGIDHFPDSKYMYFAAADVAEEWFALTRDPSLLTWAQHLLNTADQTLLDPDIAERTTRLSRIH